MMTDPSTITVRSFFAEFPPALPGSEAERRKHIHAAQVFKRNSKRAANLIVRGEDKKARQIQAGILGYLTGRRIDPGHLSWALIEISRFPEGGHA